MRRDHKGQRPGPGGASRRPAHGAGIGPGKGPGKGSGEAVSNAQWAALLAPALAGADIGLLSEAGLPAVADPGAELVANAHAAGLTVEVLAGPSSLLMALAASGLNGQGFAFLGYLPQNNSARR